MNVKKALVLGVALVAAGVAVAAPRAARAAGFLIYDVSGEAIGRASAVSASVSDSTAVWFNPAALVFQEGTSGAAGGVFLTARSSFSPAAGGADTNSERGNFFLPAAFASARVHRQVAVAMGVYSAFGIGIRWPNDWMGREGAIAASLQTLAFNPTVAIELHPQVSIAVGFDAVRGVVDFTNGLPSIVGGDVRLAGGGWGYGFNVGVLYRPIPERLQFALTYRSRVKLDFTGNADFSPGSPDFGQSLPDQPGTASITLPDMITAGLMARVRPSLVLSFDANFVRWSAYNRIDVAFQSAPPRTIEPDGQDTFTLRAGADWAAPAPGIHLRGGVVYDHNAIPSTGLGPGLPDGTRLDATAGVGYARSHLRADLGYMLVYFLAADSTSGREGPEGTYHTIAHLLGLTIGASWQ
jgi:long-chain fatty acid transport protein